MESNEAIELILEMGRSASEVTKQTNSRHGGATKKAIREERTAIQKLFFALTGHPANDEQIALATFG